MATALGLAQAWHSEIPCTEKEWFERIQLQPGEQTIISGGFTRNGTLRIVSRIERSSEDEFTVYFIDSAGPAGAERIRRGGEAFFSDALSLAW